MFGSLVTGGFEDPASGAARAQIVESSGGHNPDVLALYSSITITVDDHSLREWVQATAPRLRTQSGVEAAAMGGALTVPPAVLAMLRGRINTGRMAVGCSWTRP